MLWADIMSEIIINKASKRYRLNLQRTPLFLLWKKQKMNYTNQLSQCRTKQKVILKRSLDYFQSLSAYVSIRIDESNDASNQYIHNESEEGNEGTIANCRDIWNTYYAEIKTHIQQKLSRLLDEQTYYFRCAIMEEIKRLEYKGSAVRVDIQGISLFHDPQYWDSMYLYDICQIADSECERSFLPGGYYV